jgi:uncharacterized membrane protein
VSLRRSFPVALLTIGLIGIIGLVVLSPFALTELAHFRINWLQLSNIGQTYGAVSALLSSFALVGIAVSLLYQSRDNQNAREQTTRNLQFELIRMAMEDPSLMTAGGAPWDLDIPSDSSSIRQFLYIQLWVSFLGGNFTIGELPESAVRHIAAHELFRSEAGRNYWAAVGQVQMANSRGRRKVFFRILDDEYKETMSSGTPTARPIEESDTSAESIASPIVQPKRIRQLCMLVVAVAISILAGSFWHRKTMACSTSRTQRMLPYSIHFNGLNK